MWGSWVRIYSKQQMLVARDDLYGSGRQTQLGWGSLLITSVTGFNGPDLIIYWQSSDRWTLCVSNKQFITI